MLEPRSRTLSYTKTACKYHYVNSNLLLTFSDCFAGAIRHMNGLLNMFGTFVKFGAQSLSTMTNNGLRVNGAKSSG